MKKICIIIFVAFIGLQATNAQSLKDLKNLVNKKTGGLTEKDAASGIKDALIKGTNEGVKLVSQVNGYWNNPEIKIPFPQEASEMEDILRTAGFGDKVDEFNLSMNHAAEKAANEAKPIFLSAIKNMTITDAINIVKGDNNAATVYLKNNTSAQLNTKFQPLIKNSLDSVSATKYWDALITTYNKIPFVTKMNPNLSQYVTAKAIDGLFVMIAKEELNIRQNPAARTTDILKKVFGIK